MIKAAVLGSPISHSLSPVIHTAAYGLLGWEWAYERHDVPSGQLARFLNEHEGQFRGLSLTMPLKEEALTLIDDVTDLAKRISSVNTIIFDELGSRGVNTDVSGFTDALEHHEIAIPERVSILGGGATARSAVAAVDGRAGVIDVYSRSTNRSRGLVNSATRSIVNVIPWDRVSEGVGAELVISTTPKGATDLLSISETPGLLFESLYNPWPTPFLARWREAGGRTIDGLELLVWQAIGQLVEMDVQSSGIAHRRHDLYAVMRSAALEILG